MTFISNYLMKFLFVLNLISKYWIYWPLIEFIGLFILTI